MDTAYPGVDLEGHSARTGAVARDLARIVGVDEETAAIIGEAAYFHDIGKIAVPAHLLLAERALSQSERALVAAHTEIGARMLLEAGGLYSALAADVARYHHHRFKVGPSGRAPAGADIPFEARIVALADAYDAIRSQRPYKDALTHKQVMDRLVLGDDRLEAGAFDPVLVKALADNQYSISQTWDCVALRVLADAMLSRCSSCASFATRA